MKEMFLKLKEIFKPIDLTKGTCWKTILVFSLPVILSYLLQQIYSISDASIVGQTLSSSEVAGVNDTTSLVFIFLQFAFGVTAGFCVITSNNVGSKNIKGVKKSFATQIILSLILSIILTIIALLFLNPMLKIINITPNNKDVYEAAYTYCFVIFAGIVGQLFYNFICSFLRSIGDSFTPLMFLLFSIILNICLDLLFIITFKLGVFGAAVATVLAQVISTIACFIYTFIKYKELRLHKEDFKINLKDITSHLYQGIPLGLQFSVLAIGIIVLQSMVVKFDMIDGVMVSNAAQNGFGAANKLFYLISTPLNALGVAMTSFTAQNLGARDYERVKKGTLQALLMMVIIAFISSCISFLSTINGAYLYVFLSPDKVTSETIRYGNSYIYVDFIMFIFVGFIYIVRNCIQGIGKSQYVLIAGFAELVGRILVCIFVPKLFCNGNVDALAPSIAFISLCAADPAAWICSDLVLSIPFIKNILKKNYLYLEKQSLK